MIHILRNIGLAVVCSVIGVVASSCTMIQDDIDDCPKGLYVNFVYDYNIQRADMFKDHVGYVRLFVYDEQGRLVAEKTERNTTDRSPLAHYGYTMHFDPSELKPGKYRLQAVGLQKDYEEALAKEGARYEFQRPATSQDLHITLQHADTPHPDCGYHHVEHADAPLDTLWHTLKVMSYEPMGGTTVPDPQRTVKPFSVYPLEDQLVTVTDNMATYATVSLIRDTNHLNITLRQIDYPEDIYHDDHSIQITDANAEIGHDNGLLDGKQIMYTPYAQWTTRFDENGVTWEEGGRPSAANLEFRMENGNLAAILNSKFSNPNSRAEGPEVQRTAHYNVMFNRLIHDPNNHDNNARLQVTDNRTGNTVADINLTNILQQGRRAYDIYNYSAQEYLDRQYDYSLDFLLKGDKWVYCDIRINVLSWSLRVQNTEL